MTIYVPLLNEGTDVWRPVQAEHVREGVCRIAAQPIPDEEQWSFEPGQLVRIEQQLRGGSEGIWVAVGHAD